MFLLKRKRADACPDIFVCYSGDMKKTVFGAVVVFAGIMSGSIFYPDLSQFVRSEWNALQAAVGQIDLRQLRLWQGQGGFSHALAQGAEETDVRLIQTSLATDPAIYPEGLITGYWGQATTRALVRFQDEYQLTATGVFDSGTRALLNQIFYHQLCPVGDVSQPDLSRMHVTRAAALPEVYIPSDLVALSGRVATQGIMCVQGATADALAALFTAAEAAAIPLRVCSGYRGPDIQGYLNDEWFALEGTRSLNEVAQPYHSEHQTGTAVDISGRSTGYRCADDSFGPSMEYAWLAEHAWRYGFNLSYPQSHRDGGAVEYNYEPWHWRYVGTTLAEELHARAISYSEYLGTDNADSGERIEF